MFSSVWSTLHRNLKRNNKVAPTLLIMLLYLTNRAIWIFLTAQISNFSTSNKRLAGTCVVAKIPQLFYAIDWQATYRVVCIYYLCLIVENITPENLPILEKATFFFCSWKFWCGHMMSLRKRQPVVEFAALRFFAETNATMLKPNGCDVWIFQTSTILDNPS